MNYYEHSFLFILYPKLNSEVCDIKKGFIGSSCESYVPDVEFIVGLRGARLIRPSTDKLFATMFKVCRGKI